MNWLLRIFRRKQKNYVELDMREGDEIAAMCAYQDRVVVAITRMGDVFVIRPPA